MRGDKEMMRSSAVEQQQQQEVEAVQRVMRGMLSVVQLLRLAAQAANWQTKRLSPRLRSWAGGWALPAAFVRRFGRCLMTLISGGALLLLMLQQLLLLLLLQLIQERVRKQQCKQQRYKQQRYKQQPAAQTSQPGRWQILTAAAASRLLWQSCRVVSSSPQQSVWQSRAPPSASAATITPQQRRLWQLMLLSCQPAASRWQTVCGWSERRLPVRPSMPPVALSSGRCCRSWPHAQQQSGLLHTERRAEVVLLLLLRWLPWWWQGQELAVLLGWTTAVMMMLIGAASLACLAAFRRCVPVLLLLLQSGRAAADMQQQQRRVIMAISATVTLRMPAAVATTVTLPLE
jgi:hypothetical protein